MTAPDAPGNAPGSIVFQGIRLGQSRSWFIMLSMTLILSLNYKSSLAKPNKVKVHQDQQGWRLLVDEQALMIKGMNWGYIPIGQNYSWVLWQQPESVIKEVLETDMTLLKEMGVNAIRQYPGIPSKWVEWIYKNYGIFTIVNHTLGRYGVSVNGAWLAQTDYSNPSVREAIISEIIKVAESYKNTRGLLMYLLGNENNYGLSWTSFEAENLPKAEQDLERARPLYTLFGEAAQKIKELDSSHPIALANGDLGYINLIAEHCQAVDIMASNVYRGASSGDLFDRVAKELKRPFMYSEFGSDAYNAKTRQEDSKAQAEYLRSQWQEIYEHSYQQGKSGSAIGGLIFQWSDGWWKHKQVENLEVHDTTATWSNSAYPHDYMPNANNMNEEWFGIVAKDFPDERGVFQVRPRAAYYLLKEAFKLDPYAKTTNLQVIKAHFAALKSINFDSAYQADRAVGLAQQLAAVRLSRLRLQLESGFSKGDQRTERSAKGIIGNTQSLYFDVSAQASSKIQARASLNVLGSVAQNRLNPIFYENRGRALRPSQDEVSVNPEQDLSALERVALYQAEIKVNERYFDVNAFYRVGHYHWGDEGDFFGLYPEAYYGPNIDTYNAVAPLGAVISGKRNLRHFKVAFGPQIYWGANPGVIAKYFQRFGPLSISFIHHEDVGQNAETGSSNALPIRQSRRTALSFGYQRGGFKLDLGGLFSGSDRVGESFLWTQETSGRGYRDSGFLVHDDRIQWLDTLGTKARISYTSGRVSAYAHAVAKGLVSVAGADPRQRFTGWSLNESGNGNQIGGLAGVMFSFGAFQLAPHALYQKPLIGPMDTLEDRFNNESGIYYPGLRARNQLDDPFAVLDNRETIAAELLMVYDPTPGTWFWQWDNDLREDAKFAASLNLIYRHQPTSRDARFGVNEAGQFFAFAAAPPARDLWEAKSRWVARPNRSLRLIGHLFVGEAQARGDDTRVLLRSGGDLSLLSTSWSAKFNLALNDWGPYDYHRDYNLTYPLQAGGDLAYIYGLKSLEVTQAKLGIRGLYRSLDQYSEGYILSRSINQNLGHEWEIITYIHLDL